MWRRPYESIYRKEPAYGIERIHPHFLERPAPLRGFGDSFRIFRSFMARAPARPLAGSAPLECRPPKRPRNPRLHLRQLLPPPGRRALRRYGGALAPVAAGGDGYLPGRRRKRSWELY